MTRPLLFDAVLFDLDGTLVATDRFWVQAARTGARRAFRELGLDRALPASAEWMALVGLDLAEGFDALFADLEPGARKTILEACLAEEQRLLSAGGGVLMPGAEAALDALDQAGIAIGVASNCSRGYLEHMLAELGLAERTVGAYCLDTPGIRNKADMIARLLEECGTRAAVMVGDRRGDRDAAWENGLPHVHCAFGFAPAGEAVGAEGEIEDLGELVPLLRRRADWLAGVLDGAGIAAAGPGALGITGGAAAGKSLLARDVARLLRTMGREATAVTLETWRGAGPLDRDDPTRGYALDRLEAELLGPHRAGEAVALPRGAGLGGATRLSPDSVLVLAGPFLLDPWFRGRLEHLIHLDVPVELAWRRIQARRDEQELGRLRAELLPAIEAHAARYRPAEVADQTIEASNPLGVGPAGAPASPGSVVGA